MSELSSLIVAFEGDADRAMLLMIERVLALQHSERIEGINILAEIYYLTEVIQMKIPEADKALPQPSFIEGVRELLNFWLNIKDSFPTGFQIWAATFDAQVTAYGVTKEQLQTILEKRNNLPQ